MSLVLSHQSALDVLRTIRSLNVDVGEMDAARLVPPSAWVGKKLGPANFDSAHWQWSQPTRSNPLHVLVPTSADRARGTTIRSHVCSCSLPARSILWLDEHTSMACPELIFLQMAESLDLPMLVMLGYELCGNFSRSWHNPMGGYVTDGIAAVTSTEHIEQYLRSFGWAKGMQRAQEALPFIANHALSVPEAVLATMYSLPSAESGYGMGPVTLNERVYVGDQSAQERCRSRYPDITFDFCVVGLNYDGEDHLDFDGALALAMRLLQSESVDASTFAESLRGKFLEIREKVVDDNMRNRQLCSRGRVVFPITKEDMSSGARLDDVTSQLLGCARSIYHVDTTEYEKVLFNTSCKRDRDDLLRHLWQPGGGGRTMYGRM